MPIYPLRTLPASPRRALADAWLDEIAAALADPGVDRADLCRRTLVGIAYPEYAANYETAVADTRLGAGVRLALASLDPREITLEPEYYAECDAQRFARVKPLLWLWYSFDRTPVGGQNVDLGVRLRR